MTKENKTIKCNSFADLGKACGIPDKKENKNNYSDRNSRQSGYQSGYQHKNNSQNENNAKKENVTIEELENPKIKFLDEDTYLEQAKKNMKAESITTSKLRSHYAMLCEIIALDNAADESEENLSRQCISELRRMRVRIIYDMGRDTKVMNFIKNKNIIAYMNMLETSNKSRKDFKLFCDYFEALVAFHRYYHPNEN